MQVEKKIVSVYDTCLRIASYSHNSAEKASEGIWKFDKRLAIEYRKSEIPTAAMSFRERLLGDGDLKQQRIIQKLPRKERVVAVRSSHQRKVSPGSSMNVNIERGNLVYFLG